MIRFTCPTCKFVLKSPGDKAGAKAHCPKCGQRLQIPNPVKPAARNKTVLGEPLPDSAASSALPAPAWLDEVRAVEQKPKMPPAPSAGAVTIFCPDCNARLLVDVMRSGREVECLQCGRWFGVGADVSDAPESPPALQQSPASSFAHAAPATKRNRVDTKAFNRLKASFLSKDRKHSGLGIASFLIALLVGGLDVILAVVIAVGIARPGRHADTHDLEIKLVGGGMSMYCLNCMSVPLCLVGVGLAGVALVAHRDCNHLFTWIGLLGNGMVIFGVVGLYVWGAALSG